MVSVLGAMRDGGLAVAALYAFREPFYRRLGYASCGWRWQIKCPVHRLPPTEGGLVACRLPAEQAPALDPVYVGFVRARSGSFLRTADDWRERLGKRPPLVYAFGNPAEAYLWFSVHDAWAEVDVGEFAWTTARGYSSGLAFMAGVAANQSTVSWCEPPDGPYVSAGIDQGASVCLHRPSMFRVVDVRRALNPLASLGRPLRIEVLDRSADWNQGVWLVDGEVKPGPGRRPDVSTTVGSLAQMVLGARSARQLAADGALSASSLEAIEALEKAFPPAPVVCMDFF
jgi:predicted acetyltransferase